VRREEKLENWILQIVIIDILIMSIWWENVWNPYISEYVDIFTWIWLCMLLDYWRNSFIKILLSYDIDLCLSLFHSCDIFCLLLCVYSFNRMDWLIYTREPCLKNIISCQQRHLTTLLRVRVKKKKRKFSFCLRWQILWEYLILL